MDAAVSGTLVPYKTITFFGNRQFSYKPKSMLVMRRDFAHDMAAVVFDSTDNDSSGAYLTGTPVTLEWGLQSNMSEKLYGYIHHTEPIADYPQGALPKGVIKIVCVGASFPLKQPAQQAWQGRTASSVVIEVADAWKFSGDIPSHPQVWPSLTQDGNSTWSFLGDLAKRIGWRLYANNTDLQFEPYLRDFLTLRQTAPVFPARLIDSFHAVSGASTPDGGAKAARSIAGIDPRSGRAYVFQNDGTDLQRNQVAVAFAQPVFSEFPTMAAQSPGEAQALLDGMTATNRWYIQAQAVLKGSPVIHPGMLIVLDGISDKHNGYWYVQAVEHDISDQYVMYTTLGRDSEWDSLERPDPNRRRIVRQRLDAFGNRVTTIPDTRLVSNVWRAAYSARLNNAS